MCCPNYKINTDDISKSCNTPNIIIYKSDFLDKEGMAGGPLAPYKVKPVLGKYVQIINLNKPMTCISKIVIIDENGKIFPLISKNSECKSINNKGTIVEYTLPNPSYIQQIIINLNVFSKQSENIVNSQVVIRDSDYNIVWSSKKPLYVNEYVDVYVSERYKIYPAPQNILNPNLNTCGQEATLGYHLMSNTWY